jgi:succinoglycan biosynthesis protein ExoO
MSIPRVSALIPCYNTRECVTTAIASALAQTNVLVEAIVIDDGSNDGTKDAVSKAYGSDERVRFIRLPENKGPSAARNAGLDVARGEWIGLLDADDLWEPSRAQTLLSYSDKADFVADNLMGFDAAAGQKSGAIYQDQPEGYLTFLDFIRPNDWDRHDLGYLQPLIRRSFLNKHNIRYDEDVRAGEDLLLNLQIVTAGGRAYFVDKALYIYATPVGAISRSASPNSRSSVNTYPLINSLERLREQIGPGLDVADAAAFELRLADLKTQAPIGAFHRARANGDYFKMLSLVARESSVRKKIFKRILGIEAEGPQTQNENDIQKPESPHAR